MSTKLIGKYFYLGKEEGYHTGMIFDTVETRFLLIKLDPVKDSPTLTCLIDPYWLTFEPQDGDAMTFCALFDTREELVSWITWLNTPSNKEPKCKVVHLHNADKPQA